MTHAHVWCFDVLFVVFSNILQVYIHNSNMSRILAGISIVDQSDVVGASPVGAPTSPLET